jgi:hypothetical protein
VNNELEWSGSTRSRLHTEFALILGWEGGLNRKTHTVLVRNSLRLSLIDNSLTFM